MADDVALPTAGLIIIGDEILSGQTTDRNGPFLLQCCRERGIEVVELRIVADNEPAIVGAINSLRHRCTKVLTTGGIGPTHDDVTVRALAHAFGRPTVQHAELLARVHSYFGPSVPAAAMRLAEVPEGAFVVLDTVAVVPIITLGNVSLLPGVPQLVRSGARVALAELCGPSFVSAEVFSTAREADLAEELTCIQHEFDDLHIGSYPERSDGELRVRLRVEGRDPQRVNLAAQALRMRLPKTRRLRP